MFWVSFICGKSTVMYSSHWTLFAAFCAESVPLVMDVDQQGKLAGKLEHCLVKEINFQGALHKGRTWCTRPPCTHTRATCQENPPPTNYHIPLSLSHLGTRSPSPRAHSGQVSAMITDHCWASTLMCDLVFLFSSCVVVGLLWVWFILVVLQLFFAGFGFCVTIEEPKICYEAFVFFLYTIRSTLSSFCK